MKKIIFIFLIIFFNYIELNSNSSFDLPIVMNKCKSSYNVVAKFIIPDLMNLKSLGFILIYKDTIYDTGSIIFYIPSLNVYYVTKRDTISNRYDGDIYKLVGYDCIEYDNN